MYYSFRRINFLFKLCLLLRTGKKLLNSLKLLFAHAFAQFNTFLFFSMLNLQSEMLNEEHSNTCTVKIVPLSRFKKSYSYVTGLLSIKDNYIYYMLYLFEFLKHYSNKDQDETFN